MPRVGAQYRSADRDRVRWTLRQAFLRKVESVAPHVLQDLLDNILPVYRGAVTEGAIPALWQWDRPRWEAVEPAQYPHTARLRTEILSWGTRYCLTDDWLLDVALRTVWERYVREQESGERRDELAQVRVRYEQEGRPPGQLEAAEKALQPTPAPAGFATVPFADIEPVTPFVFEHEQWVPWWRTWADYEAELRTAFERVLREYRRARETEAVQRGLRPSPEKRDIDRHLAWLVQFQVKGQTYNAIAKGSDGADLRNVQRAIKDMARLLGLTLRRKRHPKKPASRR